LDLPCSVRDLIPQKGKMGFEQILIKTKTDDGQSTASINQGNIFLNDHNQLSNTALIEYVNQLIAAVQGYNSLGGKTPAKSGLFVGLQDAEFLGPVCRGDFLTIKKFLKEEVNQVNFVQGIIERNGERIAEFVTKIYEVKDSAELDFLTSRSKSVVAKEDLKSNNPEPPLHLRSNLHRKLYSYTHDINVEADYISFKIACASDFDGFDGHFPGNPILPGVVLLEIATLALELLLGTPVAILQIKKMKISGVVLPDQVISCAVRINRDSGPLVSFSTIFEDRNEREISRFTGTCGEG